MTTPFTKYTQAGSHEAIFTLACRLRRTWFLATRFLATWFLVAVVVGNVAAIAGDAPERRAKPPKFDPAKVSGTFFEDVSSKLQGNRPTKAAPGTKPTEASPMAEPGSGGSSPWDEVISASSIEDEIKRLRAALDTSITTPSQFASQGHKAARREFVLLNMLFWIIEHYGGDVRWKNNATLARQQFGSVGGNAKAGGNEQTYAQAKRARDLLDTLIRGGKPNVEPIEEDEISWEPVSPRRPLMRWLKDRYEADLKKWTSSEGEFKSNIEDLLREAEITAAIALFFKEAGMDDAEDEEYQKFCDQMKAGAQAVANAAKQNDLAAAQQGVGKISQACSNCHEAYR